MPSCGGGTSYITMSSAWPARTPSRSPRWTASAHFVISVRICARVVGHGTGSFPWCCPLYWDDSPARPDSLSAGRVTHFAVCR